jgi:hypothetical protein
MINEVWKNDGLGFFRIIGCRVGDCETEKRFSSLQSK